MNEHLGHFGISTHATHRGKLFRSRQYERERILKTSNHMMQVRVAANTNQKSGWFGSSTWFTSIRVKDDGAELVLAFVDWYRSPARKGVAFSIDEETSLPVIVPMTPSENKEWSRWVMMDNVEPVNIMLGKIQGQKGYFAIRAGRSEEIGY